jgi:hypothetical protein
MSLPCWLAEDDEGFGRDLLRVVAISIRTPAAFESYYRGTSAGTTAQARFTLTK